MRLRPALGAQSALIIVALFVLGGVPAWAQPASRVTVQAGGEEAVILADHIQQVGGANELLIATGNVEITHGRTRLLADRVELNQDTGEAVAQGRVVFFDDQDRLVGDRVDYNLKTGTGVVYNAQTFSAPYYRLSAERMDRIGPGLYKLHNGAFTTCEGDEPAWAFKMGSGTVDMESMAFGQDAQFWLLDKVPIIPWLPFFAAPIRKERQSGFLYPEFGSSNKKGFELKVPFYWAINDSQDLTVSLDTFTKRGEGIEGEYRYILSQQNRGNFNGFFISEFLNDQREQQGTPENRGYFFWKHNWQVTSGLAFRVDASATTDDQVFRDYGDQLHDRALQWAQTNVSLTQRWDRWSLVSNVFWYQDLTTPAAIELQRVPEIRLQGLRQPVPGLPQVQYQVDASFTDFLRVVGSGGIRLDFHPRFFVPIPVGGYFTITPFMGPRFTLYNTRAVGTSFVAEGVWVEDVIHQNSVRQQIEEGFILESRAARVFQLEDGAGINALQHIIEPRLTLLEINGVNQKARPQYDRDIDNIGHINQVAYSLINRLNAKMSGPDGEPVRWEMARLTFNQTFDIRKAINQSQPFGDFVGDLIVQPYPTPLFRLRGDFDYNPYGLGWRSASADVQGTYKDVVVTAGYRFNAISGSNFVETRVAARVLSNLDAHLSVNYDIQAGKSIENRIGFDWRFQCFVISAEYVQRKGNENEFHVAISLLGVGQIGTNTQ
ncbi:MAG TPA: LPS assembly protein LptD [Candidatus Methylomirabilis sp.]|nr:LPS assembly protein LptD [Candidatus Methylomirabilis sp.]